MRTMHHMDQHVPVKRGYQAARQDFAHVRLRQELGGRGN